MRCLDILRLLLSSTEDKAMAIKPRLSLTNSANTSDAIESFENHNAIVDALIRDCRTAVSKARIRHTRVKRDGEQLRIQFERAQHRWLRCYRQPSRYEVVDRPQASSRSADHSSTCEHELNALRKAIAQQDELEATVRRNLRHQESLLLDAVQRRDQIRASRPLAEAPAQCDNSESFEEARP